MYVSHSLSLWLDPCNWKKKIRTLWKWCCLTRPAYCKHNAEQSAFHLNKSNYRKRPVLRLAGRRGSRRQHCVPEVFKACVVLGWQKENRAVTQRKYLSSNWQAAKETQEEAKLEKIAPPGATVTEGRASSTDSLGPVARPTCHSS